MIKDRKILITGLTGRIGHAVAVDLAPHNEVWGLARFTRAGSREEVAALGVTAVQGDYVLHIAASIATATAESGMADNSDGVARLMAHCRRAKAFLHVSTTGVYDQDKDPRHVYPETNDLGGFYGGQYAATKLAGEGAARAAAIILDLPTVICRQNVQYGGPSVNGGLIDRFLDTLVETGKAFRPGTGDMICAPIHEDDICRLIEPCLGIASVPAEIIHWSGDDAVSWSELVEYAGQLLGKQPEWVDMPELQLPNCIPDPTKRKAIAGPSMVHWRDGVRRSLELRHPGIQLAKVD